MSEEKITNERVREAIFNWKNKKPAIDFPEDVERIRNVLLSTFGIDLDPHDCVDFWEWYSEYAWCAGWIPPDESSIVRGFPQWISMMEGNLWDKGIIGWDER